MTQPQPQPKLLEIHVLRNFVPSNVNRGEDGAPKSCIFGKYPRVRISSQSLKYRIRTSEEFQRFLRTIAAENGVRTRQMPNIIMERLEAAGIAEEKRDAVLPAILAIGTSKNRRKPKNDQLHTEQIIYFKHSEIDLIGDALEQLIPERTLAECKKISREEIEAYVEQHMPPDVPVDMALFGRMITSDTFRNIDSAIQVAHAVSTNKTDNEIDFFTAVDDLDTGHAGSAMMGYADFSSNTMYEYYNIDLEAYLRNLLNGDVTEARIAEFKPILEQILTALVQAIIYTTPSGKQNSYAAHNVPAAVLINVKAQKRPLNLANAFLHPIQPTLETSLLTESIRALLTHEDQLMTVYQFPILQQLWLTTESNVTAPERYTRCENVPTLLEAITEQVSQVTLSSEDDNLELLNELMAPGGV